jgi:tetratricopeptide (TPR) repeat protein
VIATSRRCKIVCLGLSVGLLAAAGIAYRAHTTGADYLLQRGRAALDQGDWDQAERSVDLLETRGYPDAAHFLRGELWLRKARIASEASALLPTTSAPSSLRRAFHELAQVQDDGPFAQEAAVLRAECLVRLGERRTAAELLQTIIQRDPDQVQAHRWSAAIFIDLNDPYHALIHLREWARLEPRNGRPYRWIGLFLSKDYLRLNEAIEAYREACRRDLDPALRADVVKELAETLLDAQSDYQAALDTLAQYPELLSRPDILTLRGQCLWGLARQADALEMVELALRAAPELPQALRLRAQMFLANGQPKAALPFLQRALGVDCHDHVGRQLLIQAYQQLGDDARVVEQQRLLDETRGYKQRLTELHEQALRHPWDFQVRRQLADLCLKLNRNAEAEMWRQAAAACLPNRSAETTLEPPDSLPKRN